MKVAVVGGGIAGLAAAQRLQQLCSDAKKSVELTLFESSNRVGGIIHTVHENGCIVELGPDSFTTLKPGAIKLCDEIGLSEHLISTNTRNRRAFIARNGKLNPIPQGFVMIAPSQFDTFFKSNILSRTGKLRMAIEQFIPPTTTHDDDESVASFVHRRFGPEAVGSIAQPMLGGIYTADINKLSLKSTMPKYLEYERRFGSVAAGLRWETRAAARVSLDQSVSDAATDIAASSHAAQSGGARYSAFVTLNGGMQMLPARLLELIGAENVHLGSTVEGITRTADGLWQLAISGSAQAFDRIILAVPSSVASKLLKSVSPDVSTLFSGIAYASSVVACLLVPRKEIKHELDGFGFVIPARENRSMLACSFSSIKFQKRCPDDQVLLRIFMGGALNPSVWQLSDDKLLRMALADLHYYLRLESAPSSHWIKRWPQSMPQYNVGHDATATAIERELTSLGGIAYAGAGLRGVGLPDCVTSGDAAARAIFLSI